MSTAVSSPSTPFELDRLQRLDRLYTRIAGVILAKQHPVTGLLPASTAITDHGDYTDAWVRDNVYSILAVWGLGLAYRKLDSQQSRAYALEQSTVKLMRGLLCAMMRQAAKVERFKHTQDPLDALHAKYDTNTGHIVVGDNEWGHLQIDATSVFLLMLAQMTASGLNIVFSLDEVNFVQNLVYYIGRAYRTPDYGIWERGNKINHGKPELNASSIGMAKAALEAIDGINLFGMRGDRNSVVHALPDDIARARITLEALLPRESNSKEVDAATLSVIGFPAFAVEDRALRDRTYRKIVEKLQGNYGCKRFLRDGHQTAIEDSTRLHYEPHELLQFEHIECEWPLFFAYLYLDRLFEGDREGIQEYREKLDAVLVEKDGWKLLPELYYVPEDLIDAERENPHSQKRLPNENVPLVWAQSLYWLGQILDEGFIELGDIDPLGRHLQRHGTQQSVVQIALLSEDEDLQAELATYGIATETPDRIDPIQVRYAEELTWIYHQIGRNDKLNLSGRPIRRLRSLTTSRIFRIRDETIVFLPSFLNQKQFYLTLDYHFLVAQLKSEIAYTSRHWYDLGRPTMVLMLTRQLVEIGQDALLNLMLQLRDGKCENTPVRLGRLNQLMLTSGTERVNFLHEAEFVKPAPKEVTVRSSYLIYNPAKSQPLTPTQEFSLECERDVEVLLEQLRRSENIYEQVEILHTLVNLEGLEFDTGFGGDREVTVADLLEELYNRASNVKVDGGEVQVHWAVVRYAAALLNKMSIGLSEAVTDILVRQKHIAIGKSYSEDSSITSPLPYEELIEKIAHFCREDIRDRVLTQEILIYLGITIQAEPTLFDGLLTLRVGYLILLLASEIVSEFGVTQDEAYGKLMQLSPFEIKTRLRQAITGYTGFDRRLQQQESLRVKPFGKAIDWQVLPAEDSDGQPEDWLRKRKRDGAAGRVPKNFYPGVWTILKHCKGLVIGDKLESRNRLDSELILAEMTPGEKNFALRVEWLLNKIQSPQYRHLTIEALMELKAIFDRNPDLQITDYIVLDVLIGHAVRLAWNERYPERIDRYEEDKAAAWSRFYEASPYICAKAIVKAFQFLSSTASEPDESPEDEAVASV
ncbi:glycoside hydrolase family 15 protein [Baaleninema simplex]|uniref:glycoside hydrolase family 15 protein n=1 Tax=Baaleninema simplex TaxID=2862350 RepID=UPI000347117E|nr:glycoside hydrolase family 15 protein [Baaleninema simplex]